MKKERKEALLNCFPPVPENLMLQMEGKGAANFAIFLTRGEELFARCFHRYCNRRIVERQRYVFAKDGCCRYGSEDGKKWTARTEFKEPVFCLASYGYNFDNSYTALNTEAVKIRYDRPEDCNTYKELLEYAKRHNYKASEGSSVKPEGDYEVLIDSAKIEDFSKADGTTTQRIKIKYVIRNDVEQKYKNACLFNDIWKKKEPNEDDLSVDGFNFAQLMAISDAAKLPDNKEYESVSAFLAELVGKPVKVHLYHDFYNGKTYEKIDKHYATDFPKVAHKAKSPAPADTYAAPPAQSFAASSAAAAVSDDDDYPF